MVAHYIVECALVGQHLTILGSEDDVAIGILHLNGLDPEVFDELVALHDYFGDNQLDGAADSPVAVVDVICAAGVVVGCLDVALDAGVGVVVVDDGILPLLASLSSLEAIAHAAV